MLNQAKECFAALAPFRRKRARCIDYVFGRQWNDLIEVEGRKMTEYEYILREGNIPLKNNLIRRIVRNVTGVFRKELPAMMKDYYDNLPEIAEENRMEELFCRTMEEFLISGMAIHRKRFGFMDGRQGIRTEIVSPSSFFFNPDSRDVRGWDVDVVGQIHEVDFRQWCTAFVNSHESFEEARKRFRGHSKHVKIVELWRKELRPLYLVHDRLKGSLGFMNPDETTATDSRQSEPCRTHLSMKRKFILKNVWRYYFLDESGTVLKEGDSPFRHGGHPYVFKCYPMLDGEIQSFVGDIIDQQRYTNRLITLYDWVVRASAKGVLLMPEGAINPAELPYVADQWSRFNGVIVYKAQPGIADPHQVTGNNANMGISELLEIQLKMLEDVSGVTGALQGNLAANSVSGSLYSQQTENAKTSLLDIMETFKSFISDCYSMDKSLKQNG